MMHRAIPAAIALLAAALVPSLASAQIFQFTFDRTQSGVDATLNVGADNAGTLIGNYDPAANPTGTRTKPGIFGPFGETENVAVPVTADVDFGGRINSETTGTFRLTLDLATGTAQISDYQADLLASGPVRFPLNATLAFSTFRTRNPTFLYPGIPLTLPLGDADITALRAEQVGVGGPGVVTQTGPDTYDITLLPLVIITTEGSFLGQPFSFPGAPAVLPIQGTLTIGTSGAVIASSRPIEFIQQQQPNQPLPQLPFPLPTTTPGVNADVLLNLILESSQASLSGTQSTRAVGLPAFCPADLNQDGVVDFNDLLEYLNRYNDNDPRADLNGDGVVDFNDLLEYLNLYNGPC